MAWEVTTATGSGNVTSNTVILLLQVSLDYIQKHLGRYGFFGGWPVIWIDQMEPDVSFDHFLHESVHRAATCRDHVEQIVTVAFFFETFRDRVNLSADPMNPIQ
jgi:hypothetical protein